MVRKVTSRSSILYVMLTKNFPPRPEQHVLIKPWLLMLLILMSGDISTNPGPHTINPCGVGKKAVRWNQDAVKCDQCDTWYHITCMQMNPITYQYLANHSDTTWICCQCGTPSFSSSLFNTTPVDLSNSFTSLNSNSASPTPVNPPNPVHTSIYP